MTSRFQRFTALFVSILILLTWGCGVEPTEMYHENVSSKIETLVEDGAWCWFSDPRAIYHKGGMEKIYVGYINSRGDVCISSKDLGSDAQNTYVLRDTLEIDDHNVPSIIILPDGKILAFYNEHNGSVFLRRSTHAEDISAWDQEQIVSQGSETYRYTYTHPARLEDENGRIYLVGRKTGPTRSFEHWSQYLKFSDDNGQSWSEEISLLDNQGRKNPPYLKASTDHESRIDFLFTDGHPKIGVDVSTYHMYYERDTFYQTNGTFIATVDNLPIPISSVHKVYDAAKSGIRSWIWDVATRGDSPVITYARFPTEADHIYHYAYWEDDHWVDHMIINSGSWMPALLQGNRVREAHYSGGVVLDHQDPSRVFLARDMFGKFEIEQLQLQHSGEWSISQVTDGSSMNNVRPYVVYGAPEGNGILLWMSGAYRHYTDYQTGIQMMALSAL